jgi:hypothetical protein
VLLNYPSKIDAFKANMPFDDFYSFSLDVMSYDYSKMDEDVRPLKK